VLADLREHKAVIVAFHSRTPGWSAADTIKAGLQFEFISGKLLAATASPTDSVKPRNVADYKALFDERTAISSSTAT
jgi:hypothetical protein